MLIEFEYITQNENFLKNETRYQSGFQNMVDLAGRISNLFLADLRQLVNLAI